MALLTDIANAVRDTINNATLSTEVVAEMTLLPVYELSKTSDLKVTVVPNSQSFERISRSDIVRKVTIDIGIQKKLPVDINSTAESLMGLVEEIAGLFHGKKLDSAICTKVENDPIYAPEHIQQYRQFTSVLKLTFKVVG